MYHIKMKAYEGDEDYIFVSYSHKDSDYVLPIIDNLHDLGYRLWFDDGIEASAEWPEYIEDHMNRCAAVLAFVTDNFVESSNCRKEITYSLNNGKPLIYVTPEPVELGRGLSLQLADQQCLDLSKMSEVKFYQKLTDANVMETCRWKAADGTVIPPQKKRRIRRKKARTAGRIIKKAVLGIILFSIAFVVLCFIIDALINKDSSVDLQPTEASHTWESDAGGAMYCKTCGVQTGELENGEKTLQGVWSTDKVSLNGADSSYFVPASTVTNCHELTLNIRVSKVDGNPYGRYRLYGRDSMGEWKIIGSFDLTAEAESETKSFHFPLSDPITFTGLAIAITDHDSSYYNIEYNVTFTGVIIDQ